MTDDPKAYYQIYEDMKSEENEKGELSRDHLFNDRYVVSEKNFTLK